MIKTDTINQYNQVAYV